MNPDASLSFAALDGGRFAPHGSGARGGSTDSAGQLHVGPLRALLLHRCRHNTSAHGRNSDRQKLEPNSARIQTTAATWSPPSMDVRRNEWNNAPACVLQHRVGARRRCETWQLRVGAVPVSINQTGRHHTVCVGHAKIARATREGLWICGQRKSVAHISTGPTEAAARFNPMIRKAGPHGHARLTAEQLREGQTNVS